MKTTRKLRLVMKGAPTQRSPQMLNECYPELIGFRNRDADAPPPKFPDTCPTCNAPATTKQIGEARYECGGRYGPKPQIQNHTDKFWGRCGKNK